MKTIYFKMFKLLFWIFIIGSQTLLSKSNYEVKILDNPAPGYLKLDRVASQIDNYGNFVFENKMNFGTYSFKQLKNGLWSQVGAYCYYLYDKNLQIVDSIINPSAFIIDPHDIISLSNGHYLLLCTENIIMDLSKVVEGGNPKANIISNVLLELDTKGNIYWQWKAIDHSDIREIVDELPLTQYTIDFTHINSMDEDANGNILVSIRHFDEVALINKSNGNFIWRMGGSKSKNNQFTFVNDTLDGFVGFSHQHSASIMTNGNILLYDNGNLKEIQYSRAVEYSMDVNSKTVTKVWEYRHSPDIYNGNMGSVYRLENGNTLVNFSNGMIVEVKPNKSIALEINNLLNDNFCYIAQKVTSNSIYSKKNITAPGNYNFNDSLNNTGVRLNLTTVSGNSIVYIQKHNYAPPIAEYADSVFSEILPYRWVITHDDKMNISGTFNLNVSTIKDLSNPERIIIFKRNKEASGIFQELSTTYNSSTGEISASFDGFGEFTVGIANKIKLKTPINDQLQVNLNCKFEWKAISDADFYVFQISKTKSFADTLHQETNLKDTSFIYSGLNNNSEYFWRVSFVKNGKASNWSDVWSFITSTQTVLPAPELSYPENNELSVGINGELNWKSSQGATAYQISVSEKSDFSTIFFKYTNLKDIKLNYSDLKYGTGYYWRVSAFNDSARSNWSISRKFLTELEPPKIISPSDNSEKIPKKGIIRWEISNDLYTYHIQISKNIDFSDIVVNSLQILAKEFEYNLNENTEYYCRIKTYNDTNQSKWCDIIRFKTDKLTSVKDYNNIENFKIYPNPACDILQIRLDENEYPADVKIYDLTGNFIFNQQLVNCYENINVSKLSKGVYIIMVNNKKRVFVKE